MSAGRARAAGKSAAKRRSPKDPVPPESSASQSDTSQEAGAEQPPPALPVLPAERKIAVLGSAASSLPLAPITDETWEFWGMPWVHTDEPDLKVSRWFEMHDREVHAEMFTAKRLELLRGLEAPVLMTRVHPDIPQSRRYPLELVQRVFAGYRMGPFGCYTSSMAYMLALAILEMPDILGTWGIDMLTRGEYEIQKAQCEYLLGNAEGRGIRVIVPAESALWKSRYPYGYQKPPAEPAITTTVIERRIEHHEVRRDKALQIAQGRESAIGELKGLRDFARHAEVDGVVPG